MKKAVAILVAVCFMLNISFAYTTKITIKGVGIKATTNAGEIIKIESNVPELSGWDVTTGNTTVDNNQVTLPAGNVEIEGIIPDANKYTLRIEFPNINRVEKNVQGKDVTVVASMMEMKFRFVEWVAEGITLMEADRFNPVLMFKMPSNDVTLRAIYAYGNEDSSGANAPKIDTGLTPVNWDGSQWVETTEDNWRYNYNSVANRRSSWSVEGNGDGAWANAISDDGSIWVWIPRYTYKIESGYHEAVKSWNSDLVDGKEENLGKILIKFSNGTTDDTTDGYLTHPAFKLGNTKLEGIWVAKYEMGMETDGVNTNTTSEAIGNVLTDGSVKMVSKPDAYSWIWISGSNLFKNAYNYNRTLDSHMIKNVEWGAIAYLTSAIGRVPYINNNELYKTGYAGKTQNAAASSTAVYEWNTESGVKSSTTHNVFGIYGISGGTYEMVAAYSANSDSTYLEDDVGDNDYLGELYNAVNNSGLDRYVDVYENKYSNTNLGDAMYETSSNVESPNTNGWDGDWSGYDLVARPGLVRGGAYSEAANSGMFFFTSYPGECSNVGTRVVLCVK